MSCDARIRDPDQSNCIGTVCKKGGCTAVVYILRLNNGQYYIGSTSNMHRRLTEHNSGKTKSTRYKLPAVLVFMQTFSTNVKARQIEAKLKKFKSRTVLETIIRDGLIKID